MVRHVDISSLLICSKHCENESGCCIYPGRLYVSYHAVYTTIPLYQTNISTILVPTLMNDDETLLF